MEPEISEWTERRDHRPKAGRVNFDNEEHDEGRIIQLRARSRIGEPSPMKIVIVTDAWHPQINWRRAHVDQVS